MDATATNFGNKKHVSPCEGGGGVRTHNLAVAETENDTMEDTNNSSELTSGERDQVSVLTLLSDGQQLWHLTTVC